ncbi:Fc.00g066510.m01.CDS01 [Cosmosporella sp. VM-42]
MAPDLDDFGLPIRRLPTPVQDAPVEEKTNGVEKVQVEEEVKSEAHIAKVEDEASPPVAEKVKRGNDEGDKFEDARSKSLSLDSKSETPAKPDKKEVLPPESSKPTEPKAEQTAEVLKHATELPKSEPDAVEPTKQVKDAEVSPDLPKAALPLESKPKTDKEKVKNMHTHDVSNASGPHGEVSEYSHQHITTHPEEEKKEDDEWQTMPAFARYDMYDDDDRLIAREHNEDDDTEKYGYAELGGAGKGYTRVIMDDDVESATSMDEHTQYLFKEANGTSMVGDEEARDAMSQMQATKDLLTEGQRIAYVGVVRLEIANLVKEAESLESTRGIKKEVGFATEAMRMWGQKMMMRTYAHMDINEAEQVMIEQLAEHGVMPQDLTPALLANSRVQNPMADDKSSQRASTSSASPSEEKPAEVPPPYEAHANEGEDMLDVKTPSQLPTTQKIDIDLRWTVLCDLFLILIADSIYDARSRVLLERVGQSLDISWIDICRFEKKVTDALEMQQAAEKENWNEDEHMENRRKRALTKRYVMMGLATVGGGLVIGLSAGLLAPVIGAGLAAGFTTIGVTGTSSFLAGAGGAAIITSSAAASGSIIGGRAAGRRTGAVQTFEYRPLHNNKRVNLIVTVSGWLTGKVDDVRLPFSTVDPIMGDLYSVLWEPDMLRSMGDTINILATEALTQGLQQILGSTILITLMSALQLPIVLTKLSYLIDNPWAVSLDRAVAAGKILADSLMERSLGTRPITLVGYSLGSRVIFSCLQELAKKGAYGVVQNVYLFGSPIVVKKEEYLRARTVVTGRFVNGYNRNDWILGYLFRLTNGGIRRVAGLAPLDELPWIENMDVTELVAGHMDYRKKMPSLLMKCGWSVDSEEFSEIEDPDPENHQERQRELINEIEEARKELEREGKAGKGGRFSIFGRRKKTERQDWEVYQDSGEKKGEKSDEKKDDNHGVLFDIDAIRAELAKEARYGDPEELQVREIKSTLPPMKLDVSSLPPSPRSPALAPEQNPRVALRETQSAETIPIRDSYETKISREPSPSLSYSRAPSYSYSRPQPPPVYGEDDNHDDIQMTFDTSFEEPKPAVPPKDEPLSRPELKPTQTLPNMTVTNPWGDPDDDDFGKEKEISMTFA